MSGHHRKKRRDIDSLLDLYWGGQERRISGLTLQMIALNGIALVMLLMGLLYFAQYHSALIDAKMRRMEAESDLIVAALSGETADESSNMGGSDIRRMRDMVTRLSQTSIQRIRVYDTQGRLKVDSREVNPRSVYNNTRREHIESIQVLTDMTKFVLRVLPGGRALPLYSEKRDLPDIAAAIEGRTSGSAWKTEDGSIFISLATPLYRNEKLIGGILLTHTAYDVTYDAESMWLKIITVFLLVFFLTVLLSIYFAGAIANPLKRLAHGAELVRKRHGGHLDIPDLRARNDEIGDLSVALRQMTKSLSQRVDAIENFVADVAHELKNPLTSLRSAVETLDIARTKKDKGRLMDVIQHDVRRMDRLISDISHASRLDAALSRDTAHAVDVAKVLRDILKRAAPALSGRRADADGGESLFSADIGGVRVVAHGLDTTRDWSGEPLYVWGVESRLEQVFQNILQNAISFSPQGGQVDIMLRISEENEKFVQVIVQDEGGGIPVENLEKIFDRFYTERPQEESYGEHSGLGLAICRQIVETFGGRIHARNVSANTSNNASNNISGKPVHGACFIVELRRVSPVS